MRWKGRNAIQFSVDCCSVAAYKRHYCTRLTLYISMQNQTVKHCNNSRYLLCCRLYKLTLCSTIFSLYLSSSSLVFVCSFFIASSNALADRYIIPVNCMQTHSYYPINVKKTISFTNVKAHILSEISKTAKIILVLYNWAMDLI